MGLRERLGNFLASRGKEASKERPVTVYDDNWCYGVYHSPGDWEAHCLKKLREFHEHDKEMEEKRAQLAKEILPPLPTISPYGGGGKLTEIRNIGERSDRDRGWTI